MTTSSIPASPTSRLLNLETSICVCCIALHALYADTPDKNNDSNTQAASSTASNKKKSTNAPRSVITMNQEQRIKGNIAADALNRIAVVNDRIIQVFGDQDAYELVIDETIGQVFIKPTEANGNKPLSLSFVTASYTTQDLLLTPTSMDAATLLFRNPSQTSLAQTSLGQTNLGQAHSLQTHSPQEITKLGATKWLEVMRSWILHTDQHSDGSNPPDERSHQGCTMSLETWRDFQGYQVSKWTIKNDTSTPLEVNEEDFHQPHDVALALLKTILGIGEETTLYVVSQSTSFEDVSQTGDVA
jgi:hypothetical protein